MKDPNSLLTFRWTDHSSNNLKARILQLRKNDRRIELDVPTEAIQFLRGVASRASFVLPEFYEHVGSVAYRERKDIPYWQKVRAASAANSSLQSISLACRSIFDDSRKGMTGKTFSLISDDDLLRVARYWSSKREGQVESAAQALVFLRCVFQACSKQRKVLLDESSLLARRIGLLKYYADRYAAHISLETYLFHLSDLIHVVAALIVLGAVIDDFDDPTKGDRYFDGIDEAAWHAGETTYPNLPIPRLFKRIMILQQGRLYCKLERANGLDMFLNQLPAVLGYWDSEEANTPG
jgi:hypothetical protein